MNKTVTAIVASVLAICCFTAIAFAATGSFGTPTKQETPPKTAVNSEKVYFSYYNTGSGKGAVAFSLDNNFIGYGNSQGSIQLCTKNEQGSYVSLYSIDKGNTDVRFYGKSEHIIGTDSSKTGGLSSIGISFDYDKTNVCFLLYNQPVEAGKTYYIYIPEDYFLDASGNPNAGAYIEIPSSKTNSYTGKLAQDLEKLLDSVYDTVIFGAESINGMLF